MVSPRCPVLERNRERSFFGVLVCLIASTGAFLTLSCSPVVKTSTVTLAWNPAKDSTVLGHRLYCGPRSGVYDHAEDVGNVTRFTLADLEYGRQYFFAVTAYSTKIESGFSNETRYSKKVDPPQKGLAPVLSGSNQTQDSQGEIHQERLHWWTLVIAVAECMIVLSTIVLKLRRKGL
jgi:hypothetical protein